MATPAEIRHAIEWKKCKASLVYFLSTYWKVETVGVGYDRFDLFDYQIHDAELFESVCHFADKQLSNPSWKPTEDERLRLRQVRLKARQLGWTTLGAGATFWSAYFFNSHPWLLLAQGEKDAAKTLSRKIKTPYAQLPHWMREMGPNETRVTSEEIEWDNGSSIASLPSTESAGRGQAVFGTLMDESAFMADASEVYASVEPMTYGPLFMWSTANGMGNFFHETWLDSQLHDSEWEGTFHAWSARPGRDADWYQRTLRKYRTKQHLFYQEYPSTPEEAFLKSGRTAFPMDEMREMDWMPPAARYDLVLMRSMALQEPPPPVDVVLDAAEITDPLADKDIELHVWHHPTVERYENGMLKRAPNYVLSADVAEGLEHGDYSTINVYDVNRRVQCATVKAHIPVHDLDEYVSLIGYWYHTALVGVERNNHGLLPNAKLQSSRYPRLYRPKQVAQIQMGDRSPRYGFHTNKTTKPKMVQDFSSNIVHGTITLHDDRLLREANTFLADGKGGYNASPGNNDDLVVAAMIGVQLMDEVGEYPIEWIDPKPGPTTWDDIDGIIRAMRDGGRGAGLGTPIGQTGQRGAKVVRSFELQPL